MARMSWPLCFSPLTESAALPASSAERAGCQQHPRLLLRRGVGLGAIGLGHHVDQARHLGLGDAGLGGERDQRRAVAHAGAVVAPRHAVVLAGDALERGLERLLGAGLVAEHGERGTELGLRQRGREAVELGVDVVAQLADRRAAVAGEHVEGIGAPLAARLEVLRVADEVLQPVERLVEGLLAHDVAGLLGPRQEVGDVAGEPHVAVRRTPDAEGARAVLHLEHAGDRAVDALAQGHVGGEPHALGHVVDVEQRQGAARRLLGAAVGVAVERRRGCPARRARRWARP